MNKQQPAAETQSPKKTLPRSRKTRLSEHRLAATGAARNRQKTPASAEAQGKQLSKQDQLAALLVRDEGATIDQMIALTGWLPHTIRAALTGLRKKGYAIDNDKVGGTRTYRGVAPQ